MRERDLKVGASDREREREMERYGELRRAVEMAELIDGHAHNLVAIDSSQPFISCFSEANGEALSFVPHTLSFKRGIRDIAELYKTETSLQAIEEHRRSSGLQKISSTCFKAAKIAAILIDDGIEFDKKQETQWHRSLAPVVGRILRIERLAEQILDEGRADGDSWTFDAFMEAFTGTLNSVADQIVGLKSIAAYRSGLEIDTTVTRKQAEEALIEVLHSSSPIRITNKNFIDYLFMQSLEVAVQYDMPLQIHTGFGDKDLDLRLANPLHLRSLLEDERFSKCKIVLLHASYPFSKEASYLASVYPQVYLDFGLAIPKLSVQGMISSVKELLELAPTKKVLFSTDGYAFPETFYLGAKRSREVVFSVLQDACNDGDLSIPEAIEAVKDIFSENAMKLYKIHIDVKPFDYQTNFSQNSEMLEVHPLQSPKIGLVRILWVDGSGQHRCRVVPEKRFRDVVVKNGIGLTVACMAMTSFLDGPADGTNLSGVGEIRLMADLSTKLRIPWSNEEEMVLADMHMKPGEAWEYCPREALRRVSKILKDEFNLVMNAGFENEFYLLKSFSREGKEEWVPYDATPYCSAASIDAASPIFREILGALDAMNIPVEQIHAEAGKGQFELALGYTLCTKAANNLVFVHQAVRAVARKHGLLATFMPKYALDDIGSGSHVHLSLWEDGKNVFMASDGHSEHGMSKVGEEFMAGVLNHLPSILAFTAPIPNSYDRIQPNTWSGAYQCWGKENREAPLRTACPPGAPHGIVTNFEIKAFDGCANPHLGLAAIIAAGIDGLRQHLTLPEPIDANPFDVASQLERLPQSLSESVEALENDKVLREMIGEKLFAAIRGVRKAEIAYYSENEEAYKQLIHRY